MHTKTQLEQIKSEISRDIQGALGDNLHKIILYGSYARGDYNEDSDIDIMVLADIEEDKMHLFRSMANKVASRISLEHDALVTISVRNSPLFYSRMKILPFYQNVIKEGVVIYGH
ncbi:MAG: nucleotidyltransferase domain-containing protein [Oscillospiraceae bacterium]|nr:nucleotidyltransferase domain-containing protein [Oscillospiraceae bacterium]